MKTGDTVLRSMNSTLNLSQIESLQQRLLKHPVYDAVNNAVQRNQRLVQSSFNVCEPNFRQCKSNQRHVRDETGRVQIESWRVWAGV